MTTDELVAKIADDPAISAKINLWRKTTARLKLAPATTFRREVGTLLVDAGIVGPWELDFVDFEALRYGEDAPLGGA